MAGFGGGTAKAITWARSSVGRVVDMVGGAVTAGVRETTARGQAGTGDTERGVLLGLGALGHEHSPDWNAYRHSLSTSKMADPYFEVKA